ncbi:MAG: ADOP family duplicated permease [Betaproteobacteria bacterium]
MRIAGIVERLRRLSTRDADLDEEIQFHLRASADDRMARGESADEAAVRAHREFGNVTLVKEVTRGMWGWTWLDRLLQDVGYALRLLRRSPGFAAAALVTLALGIGATTAVFSVVYDVLLKPLPYPNAGRLVRVWEEHPPGRAVAGNRWLSNRTYFAWIEHARTLDALGAFGLYEYAFASGDDVSRVFGSEVSPSMPSVLGARPVLGRLLTDADAAENAPKVIVLGESMWRRQFGGDAGVIGRSVTVDGEPRRIVGVVAAGFVFPDRRARFWLPDRIRPVPTDPKSQGTSVFSAIGRLAPGITLAQAEAEGTAAALSAPVTLATRMLFGSGSAPVVHVRPLVDDMSAQVRPALLVLAGAVALVLLITCANVASLLMSRGIARQRELAIRAAIGAGRGRLARQLMTESFVLAALGGALGLALAAALVSLLPALAPPQFPRLDDARIDWRVLAIAAAASIVAAVASGLAPAVRAGAAAAAEALRGAPAGQGRVTRTLRNTLVVAETAFAVPLLVGAILLAQSFVRLAHVDAGYDAQHVLAARVEVLGEQVPGRSARLLDTLLPALRGRPDVAAAGAGSMMPLSARTAITSFRLPPPDGGPPVETHALTYRVTPGYAEALGLRLRAGRFFTDADANAGVRRMLVNEAFARQYLAGGPVVGRRFGDLYNDEHGTTTEIVGVVGNVLKDGNDQKPEPEVYFADGASLGGSSRRIQGYINVVVRSTGNPAVLAADVRSLIRGIDRTASIDAIEPLAAAVDRSMDEPRFATTVLMTFGLLALTLAAVGLYGVLAFGVAQRRRELGVRAALGAGRGRLVGMVLREGLGLTLGGLALGLLAAAAVTRLLESLLFGVTPLDPLAFLAAPLALVLVAVVACALPARRAATVDPAEALRCD